MLQISLFILMLSAAGCSTFTTETLGDLFPSEVIISHVNFLHNLIIGIKVRTKVIPTISGGLEHKVQSALRMKQQNLYFASIELVATLGFTRLGRIG